MSPVEDRRRILLIEPNIVFARLLAEALRHHGFEVLHCTQVDYALTMVEWSMPVAVLCATTLRESDGIEVARVLENDPKTGHIPVIALGYGQAQGLIHAYRAGYAEFLDRRLGAENIAGRVVALLSGGRESSQPIQSLADAESALNGRLSVIDLSSVIQVVAQSFLTGALHINTDSVDGIIYFLRGEIFHAESGLLIGHDAATHLLKSCHSVDNGMYQFVAGSISSTRTVQKSVTEIILGAMRELDEKHGHMPATGS